jgi:hypothetical protein
MSDLVGNNFDEKQLIAIELFIEGKSCTEVSEQLNVHKSTISRWRANPNFRQAIVDGARQELRLDLPSIYKVAATNAKSGSAAHIKLILDHLDNLDKLTADKAEKVISFTWSVNDPDPVPTESIPS